MVNFGFVIVYYLFEFLMALLNLFLAFLYFFKLEFEHEEDDFYC